MTAHGKRTRGGGRPGAARGGARTPAPKPRTKPQPRPEPSPALPEGPLRLGVIPGATPGKWLDVWQQRMPRNPVELTHLAVGEEAAALRDGSVDAVIARLPLDRDGLHVIPLYREVPVVVCGAESDLTVAEELRLEDLAGEVRIVPADDVLHTDLPGTVAPVFDAPATTEEAVATVAAGVGITVVPMSLARLHHRKDVTFRILADGPESPVGLAWPVEDASPLVDVFVGVVRGRSVNSSRG
ncbi:LysR family substrate-binding domain-containing protein [Microbacterium sp. GXF7504]